DPTDLAGWRRRSPGRARRAGCSHRGSIEDQPYATSGSRFLMIVDVSRRCRLPGDRTDRQGSVLIIVLWIAFGLVSLALYFANSTSLELRAADNRSASIEAEQAIAGAARYVGNVLTNMAAWGALPDTNSYQFADVPVGNAAFWLIGRGNA